MVRINRVYTRKGDSGNTSLVGGRKASKDDPRVACYGTVDELNAVIGIVRSLNAEKGSAGEREGFDRALLTIQQRLFDLGAELATPPESASNSQPKVDDQDVAWLEKIMDRLNADLPPLESFILPGGGPLNAFLHHARTVCRRAEREVVALGRAEPVSAEALAYLNRLSDALFVLSRWVAAHLGEKETLWQPGLKPDDSWP